jgi:hypothetical protein
MHRELEVDSIEILKKMIAREVIYKDKKAISTEVNTLKNGKNYMFYTIYTIDSDYLYDFTLKLNERRKKDYYNKFTIVLFNFQINKRFLFAKSDSILDIRELDESSYQ